MPVRRDHPVGMGPEGPQRAFLNFKDRLGGLLGELAEDVELGAYNLKAALEAFDAVDNDERDRFQEKESCLEESASKVEEAQSRQKPVSDDPRSQNKTGPADVSECSGATWMLPHYT